MIRSSWISGELLIHRVKAFWRRVNRFLSRQQEERGTTRNPITLIGHRVMMIRTLMSVQLQHCCGHPIPHSTALHTKHTHDDTPNDIIFLITAKTQIMICLVRAVCKYKRCGDKRFSVQPDSELMPVKRFIKVDAI